MYSVFANIRTVGDLFRSIKWAWQRAIKGYCELDTYSVGDWFLNILPDMIESVKNNRMGVPSVLMEEAMEYYKLNSVDEYNDAPEELRRKIDEYGDEKWNAILTRMIFLLRESNADTCTRCNPYEGAYLRIWAEFREKYGEWGESLWPDEREAAEEYRGKVICFPAHLPEYKEISDKYFEEERKIGEYQMRCKDAALELFSKWFYNLWI